jgi:HK97 family phage portal protein
VADTLPARRSVGRLTRSVATLRRSFPVLSGAKDIFDPSRGQGAGWSNVIGGPSQRTGPKVQSLMDVFAGTDTNVGWVYACVDKIAGEMSGYPWQTVKNWEQPNEKIVPAPDDLRELLLEPSEENTYADWVYLLTADCELVGNSYWLEDQMDTEGKPAEILRLHPNLIQIVVDKFDRRIGYVYTIGGIQIPLRVDQILHYRYPNPLNAHYGMGTLEGIIRAVDSELAQSAHVTSFFRQGTHLSGVLTVPETLGEDEFDRIKKQYQEEFSKANNSFRILIAEGSAEFKTISTTPQASGVVDLRKLAKDEILTGFHCPEGILGGVASANGDLEQDMLVFGRAMSPKAGRISVRTSLGLTGKWDALGFKLMPEQAEPRSMKIKRGREMLGAGASLNDSREEAGLPRLNRPDADEPLVPGGLMPLRQIMERPTAPRPQDKPNLGPDEPHLVGAGDPSGGQLPTRAATMLEEGKTLGEVAEALAPEFGYNEDGLLSLLTQAVAERRHATRALPAPADEAQKLEPPALPNGFEDWSGWTVKRANVDDAQRALDAKARFLLAAVPDLQGAMTAFFLTQRRATLARFQDVRSTTPRVKGQPYEGKGEPAIAQAWDEGVENERLESLLSAAVERLGREGPLPWQGEREVETEIRDAILSHAQGINETTRKALAEQIEEGVRRNYSIAKIANGNSDEDYAGIAGVFDDATTGRAGLIAVTETATIYNLADIEQMTAIDQSDEVEVLDGEGDPECAEANGSIWPLAEAKARVLGHPRCVRTFVAIPRP